MLKYWQDVNSLISDMNYVLVGHFVLQITTVWLYPAAFLPPKSDLNV